MRGGEGRGGESGVGGLNPPPPAKILLILPISALKIMAGQWPL